MAQFPPLTSPLWWRHAWRHRRGLRWYHATPVCRARLSRDRNDFRVFPDHRHRKFVFAVVFWKGIQEPCNELSFCGIFVLSKRLETTGVVKFFESETRLERSRQYIVVVEARGRGRALYACQVVPGTLGVKEFHSLREFSSPIAHVWRRHCIQSVLLRLTL